MLVLFGIAVFFYQTLDALDGKQARRLQLASPLGQLFDHGLDAVAATGLSMMGVYALGVQGWSALAIGSVGGILCYIANAAENTTNILLTGVGHVGVTEIQWTQIIGMLLAALWSSLGLGQLGKLHVLFLSVSEIIGVVVLILLTHNFIGNFAEVKKAGKIRPFLITLLPLAGIIFTSKHHTQNSCTLLDWAGA